MVKERTYKKQIEAQQAHMSPESIRRNKNLRKKTAHDFVTEQNRAQAEQRKEVTLAASYPAKQLQRLDWRLGVGVGAVKERTRLTKRIK